MHERWSAGGSRVTATNTKENNMLKTIGTWLLKNRIAATSIAIEQAERTRQHIDGKIEQLAQREIELRIRYSQQHPLPHRRHIVTLPGAR